MNALDYFEASQHQKKLIPSTPQSFHGRNKPENDTPIKRIALSEIKPNQERLLSAGARRVVVSTPQKENLHLMPSHTTKVNEPKSNYMKPTQAYKNALEDVSNTPKRLVNRKTTFSHRTPVTPGPTSIVKVSKKSKSVTPQDGVLGTPNSKSISTKDPSHHILDEERKKHLTQSPRAHTPTRIARPQSAPKTRPEGFTASPHHVPSVAKHDTESISTARSNSRLRSHQAIESNQQHCHTILFSPPRTTLGTPKADTPRNQTPRSQSAPKPRPSPLNLFKHEHLEGEFFAKRQQFDSPQVPTSEKYMELLSSPPLDKHENQLAGRKAHPVDSGSKSKTNNKMKSNSSAYHSQAPPITANKLSAFKAAKQAIMAKAKNSISTSSSFARYSAPTFAAHIRNREQQQSHAHLQHNQASVGISKPLSRPTPSKDTHPSSATISSGDTRVRSYKGAENNGDGKFRDIAIKVYEDDLFDVVKAMETPKEVQHKQFLFTSNFRKAESPVSNGALLVRQPSTHSIMSLGSSSTYDPLYDIPNDDNSHKYQPNTNKAHYFLHEDGVEYSAIESPHVQNVDVESASPSISSKLNQALISIPSIDRASLCKQDDESSSQSIWINPSLSGSNMYPPYLRLQESINQDSGSCYHPANHPSAVCTKDISVNNANAKTKSFEIDLSSVPDCENHVVADEVSFQESFDGSIKNDLAKVRQQQSSMQSMVATYNKIEMHLSNELDDVSRVECGGSFSPHNLSESFTSTFGNESIKSICSLRESFGRKSLNNFPETSFSGGICSHVAPSTKSSNAVLSFEAERICSIDENREGDIDMNGNRDERYSTLSISQFNNSLRAGIPPLRRSTSNPNKLDASSGIFRSKPTSLERQNSVPDESLLEEMAIYDEDHIKPMYESEVPSLSMLDQYTVTSSTLNNELDVGVLYTSSGSVAITGEANSTQILSGNQGSMNSTGIHFISPSLDIANDVRTTQQDFDAVDRHIVTNYGSRSMEESGVEQTPTLKSGNMFLVGKPQYLLSPASLMYELSGNDRSDLLVGKMKTPTSAPPSQVVGSSMKSPFFSFQASDRISSKSIETNQIDADDSAQCGIEDLLMYENPSSPHILRVENADQVNRGDDGSSGICGSSGNNTDFDCDNSETKTLNTAIIMPSTDESSGSNYCNAVNSALFSFNDFGTNSNCGRDLSNGTHATANTFSMPKLMNSSFDFEVRGNSLPVPINITHHSKKSTTFQAIEEQQLSLRLSGGQISSMDIRKQKQSSPVSLPTRSSENMTLSTILPIGEDDSIVTENDVRNSIGEKDLSEESIGTFSVLLESKDGASRPFNYLEINDRYQAVLNGISLASTVETQVPLPPPVSITTYAQQITQTMPPLPPNITRATVPVQTTTPLALFSRSLGGFLQDESSMLSVDDSQQLSTISETLTNSQSSYSSSMEELGRVTGKSPNRTILTNTTRETIALLLTEKPLIVEEISTNSSMNPLTSATSDEFQCYDPLAKQLFTNSHLHLRERNVKCLEKTFVPVDTSDIDHSS